MNFRKITTLVGFIILSIITTLIASAEEPSVAPTDSTVVSVGQQVTPKNINETQWAWGEVINLDVQAKTLTLKYLDYETDQEKDLVLAVDEKTTFENIKSFDEIKIKDTLSIDYMVGSDGKNVAKNINLEKSDASPAAVTPAAENTKPVETTTERSADKQVVVPVESPAPVLTPVPTAAGVSVPEVAQPTAQSATATESSAPASETPAQPASTPAPAVQQNQSY